MAQQVPSGAPNTGHYNITVNYNDFSNRQVTPR